MPFKSLEKRKEYNKEYYEKNREKLLIQKKEYFLKHKEEIILKNSLYQKNNKEKVYACHTKWNRLKKSRDDVFRKEENIRRYTNNKYGDIKGNCERCGAEAKHKHHTTKPYHVDKFILLCPKCHAKIHKEEKKQ
jgi:hypothetical protein